MMFAKKLILTSLLCIAGGMAIIAQTSDKPLIIQEQGSFMVGGITKGTPGKFTFEDFRNPAGQKSHGDHAYVSYQFPIDANATPLVFLHGGGQSGKTWESTPDGREGFRSIFLRKGYKVYIVDQPRRGRAGSSTEPARVNPMFNDIMLYSLFRIGNYPDMFPGVQFPKDAESLDQLFRQATPDTGPYDDIVTSNAMAALFDKIGPATLVTHSRGGYPGWLTALKSPNVKAIVAFEPGGSPFVFPEGEVPEDVPTAYGVLKGQAIPMAEFIKFTQIPIVIYYGDNIATAPVSHVGQDQWRGEMQMACAFADAVNRHGGNAQVVHLPEIGIKGNTHFPMSDLNNAEIADLMQKWLHEKRLDMKTTEPEFQSAGMTFPADDKVKMQKVYYQNRLGITLCANLYMPMDMNLDEQHPAIIVGHPYGGVKEQCSGLYAQQMAKRGFVTLAFDASYQGESGGTPRQTVSPDALVEDFSASVDWLGIQPFIDRNRIGVIGICGSGGFSICAASLDPRIKALATVSMYDMGRATRNGLGDSMTDEQRRKLLEDVAEQRWKEAEGAEPLIRFGTPEQLPDNASPVQKEFFGYYRNKERGYHPRYLGTRYTSQAALMNFYPFAMIKEISPRPLLFIAGENAHSRYFSEDAYRQANEPKELYIVPDANHVDLYDQMDKIPFDKLTDFFIKALQ